VTIDPKELLTAYASGDVSDDERRVVEDYLESEPAAKDELRAIEAVLAEVRAAEPMPAKLPDMEALTASTMSEIRKLESESSAQPTTSPWMRVGAWSAGLAVAVMALLFLVIRDSGDEVARVGLDAGATVARTHSQNPDATDLAAELPSAEWLMPRPEPRIASAEGLDVLADDWLIGDDQQDDVVLDDLDLDELKAIDEALASL
jgi:anti-sigma factor RsiW